MLIIITPRDSATISDKQIKFAIENNLPILFDSTYELEFQQTGPFQVLISHLNGRPWPVTILLPTYSIPFSTREKFNNFKFITWPTFWILRTWFLFSDVNGSACIANKLNNLDINNDNVNIDIADYQYLYLSTNFRVKTHRCMMMDMLAKHNLIDRGAIAWHNVDYSGNNVENGDGYNYRYKYWTCEISYLDQKSHMGYLPSQETLPVHYASSFMHLVTETHTSEFCISEKTAVPLLFNKPFLVVGSMGFHGDLNSLGFALYDEIFDYSFDSNPSKIERCEGIALNIKRLSTKTNDELQRMYKLILPKIKHNRNLAIKYATRPSMWPKGISELLPYYDKQNVVCGIEIVNRVIDKL